MIDMQVSRTMARTAVAATVATASALALSTPASANPTTYATQTIYTAACPDAQQSIDIYGTTITAKTTVNKAMGAQCTAGTVLNQAVYIINYQGTVLTSQGAADTVGDLGYTYSATNVLSYTLPRGSRVELQSVTITNGVNSRTHVLRIYASGRIESLVL
ncbi:hypothetical protein MRQ36_28745 [Micromonospora sp. R77]|uniref:hypothetical protein n=1 Tax=Micromonospora sp. R77 TaxID=2925836 RepID=UPI001F619B33|nr:hypothetical protein [Micromonospora sp. R77]MCI4066326.1 hypothetical protein [Micromonospora sp. R77]